MCALLGVVPPPYLCGHSFQSCNRNRDVEGYWGLGFTSRIAWVPISSTDPKVDAQCAKARWKNEELDEFLLKLYNNMFSYEIAPTDPSPRWYRYNRRSFAVLLEFIKRKDRRGMG